MKNRQDKLRKLQEKYVAMLPSKIDELNEAWSQATFTQDASALDDVGQIAHKLAGSAGTFGFPSVSVEARKLEIFLREHVDDQGLSEEVKEFVGNSLHNIAALVDAGPHELGSCTDLGRVEVAEDSQSEKLVYVIEDDELLSKEIASQVSYFGYEVVTLTTIEDALNIIKIHLPAAMIVDIQFEGNDLAGPEFAQLFFESSKLLVPTIFISSRDDWQARLSAVRAHGSAYLTKPLEFNDLLERLDRVTTKTMPEPFRILVVDDMEILAEHYAAVLGRAGMEVMIVSDMDNLLGVLSDFKPELVIMDINMPQCSGLEAAKVMRQKDELLSVPIVFLSTELDSVNHVSAMEIGGDDFLQKPIEDEHLVIAVRTRASRFRELRGHMHRDGLTGLLNHVTIKTHLEADITRACRHDMPLCFAMIDIDHFKKVNDTYGHPIGDRVIKSVARMLIKRLRKSDAIGRYGGEEFAIILPETDIENAKILLDDVRENFSQIVQQSNDEQFSCTLSVGITELTTNGNIEHLIKTADAALYDAKQSGRNKVCIK